MDTDSLKLTPEQLRRVCDPDRFAFATTEEVAPLEEVIGQDRAVRAIQFGLDIKSSGFNLFLAGQPGTGKTTILKRILECVDGEEPIPDDVLFVHNFDDPDCPKVLTLPAGMGERLQSDIEELVEDLKVRIPKAFEGKDYEEQHRETVEQHQKRKQELLEDLEKEAIEAGFELKSTPLGFRTIPVRDDKPLTQEEYQGMEEAEREKLDAEMEAVQERIRAAMADMKAVDDALKQDLREFNQKVAMNILGNLMLDLHFRYREYPDTFAYLEKFQRDVLENIEQFRGDDDDAPTPPAMPGFKVYKQEADFTRYSVNLAVDNSGLECPPVVVEKNPTYANLVGRIERRAQFGALVTDFTMIRAGSLAKANGGYLVLNVEDVLRNRFTYEALKHALMNREVRIEDMAERYGLLSSATLRPEPLALDVKVCLIGNPRYYHLLFGFDETFREIFKVKVDFDFQTDRDDDSLAKFGAFVARLVEREGLPHFDRSAVAALVEESSRFVSDQEKLSLRFAEVNDLIREAAYWAREEEADVVSAEHILRAVEEAEFRSSLAKERLQEMIERDILVVASDGQRVGQVNALVVHMLGDYRFGRPSRITAAVFIGREGVINIERRVQMSHGTHDKGVMILSGFIGDRFAQNAPLTLSGSLAFEQSYGRVAGDSASSTELYVLLSALADVPIDQGIAVTGSVNQHGDVQAIGGVNHKIEGFFDICAARGLTGTQGVLIPRSNVQHLMLHRRVVEAVQAGQFQIWAIDHVDEGIEILTGIEAGVRDDEGEWTPDSINDRVQKRLDRLGQRMVQWGKEAAQPTPEIVAVDFSDETPEPPKPPEGPEG